MSWNFMCNVDRVVINVLDKEAYLYLPDLNYPDMSSTIKNFTSADAECNTIYVYVDEKLDLVYVLNKDVDRWEVRCASN